MLVFFAGERTLKSEISNLQVEKSLLESCVKGLMSTCADEKATLISLEWKLAEERRQKTDFQVENLILILIWKSVFCCLSSTNFRSILLRVAFSSARVDIRPFTWDSNNDFSTCKIGNWTWMKWFKNKFLRFLQVKEHWSPKFPICKLRNHYWNLVWKV